MALSLFMVTSLLFSLDHGENLLGEHSLLVLLAFLPLFLLVLLQAVVVAAHAADELVILLIVAFNIFFLETGVFFLE